jgi:hypothetical protein
MILVLQCAALIDRWEESATLKLTVFQRTLSANCQFSFHLQVGRQKEEKLAIPVVIPQL